MKYAYRKLLLFLASATCFQAAHAGFLFDLFGQKTEVVSTILSFFGRHTKNVSAKWFSAVRHGNIDSIHGLLLNVDINSRDEIGRTALSWATFYGNQELVKLLLQMPGIDVNIQDKWNYSALHFAAKAHENIVRLLLQTPNIDVNLRDILDQTALLEAITHEQENVIKLLLQMPKINANIRNRLDDTALILASKQGNIGMVEQLLELPRINIIARNRQGKTALMVAQENGFIECARKIQQKIDELEHRAFEAVRRNQAAVLHNIISQIGINFVDKNGLSLLDRAFRANHAPIIELILQKAKDPRKLLSELPFQSVDPNSELYKYCFNLAYLKFCANPQCPNPQGECTQNCSRCKKAYYCSADCQRAHWKSHKSNCVKS